MSLQFLPKEITHKIISFLSIKDISNLGQTSLRLKEILDIRVKRIQKTDIYEEIENADQLYCQFTIDELFKDSSIPRNLTMMKFNFKTKDQGWISQKSSCSWIEAEFDDVAGNSLINQGQCKQTESTRLPLVWNYQVCHYQNKTKLISCPKILSKIQTVRIYLRSRLAKNTISCKQAELMLFYGPSEVSISQKQIEETRLMRRKRPLRRC